jgi:hypothetical protein
MPQERRQPVVELQRRFSAATLEMDAAWAMFRQDWENRDLLRRYTRTLDRCHTLKTAIFAMMTARREQRERRAA